MVGWFGDGDGDGGEEVEETMQKEYSKMRQLGRATVYFAETCLSVCHYGVTHSTDVCVLIDI